MHFSQFYADIQKNINSACLLRNLQYMYLCCSQIHLAFWYKEQKKSKIGLLLTYKVLCTVKAELRYIIIICTILTKYYILKYYIDDQDPLLWKIDLDPNLENFQSLSFAYSFVLLLLLHVLPYFIIMISFLFL